MISNACFLNRAHALVFLWDYYLMLYWRTQTKMLGVWGVNEGSDSLHSLDAGENQEWNEAVE